MLLIIGLAALLLLDFRLIHSRAHEKRQMGKYQMGESTTTLPLALVEALVEEGGDLGRVDDAVVLMEAHEGASATVWMRGDYEMTDCCFGLMSLPGYRTQGAGQLARYVHQGGVGLLRTR